MKNNDSKKIHGALYVVIGLGIGIRIFQFLYNRSLWYDEATLALNIVQKDFVQLAAPLDYNQVAPILYLYLQKSLTLLLGEHDFVLRIASVIGGILFLYLSYVLSKLFLDKTGALFTSAILAMSYPLVYYTTEAKPYILDALTFVTLYFFYFKSTKNRKWKIYFSIGGIVAVWFSFSSIFALTSIALFSTVEQFISKISQKKIIAQLGMHLPWVISFLVNYYFIISGHSNTGQMTNFWEQHFMPSIFPIDDFLIWNAKHFAQLFYTILGFGKWISLLSIGLCLVSIFQIIKNKDFKILMFCFPLILHLGLSWMHIYPFAERLILYAAFTIAFLITYGLNKIENNFSSILLIAILSINLSFILFKKLPIEREEIKPAITYLNKNLRSDQQLYIYYGAVPAIKFYQNQLKHKNIIFGKEHRGNHDEYFEEIKQIQGSFGLICSHYLEPEVKDILQYIEEICFSGSKKAVFSEKKLKIFLFEKE